MGSPGNCIIAHAKPSLQGSWAPNGISGWYIDRAKELLSAYQIVCTY